MKGQIRRPEAHRRQQQGRTRRPLLRLQDRAPVRQKRRRRRPDVLAPKRFDILNVLSAKPPHLPQTRSKGTDT